MIYLLFLSFVYSCLRAFKTFIDRDDLFKNREQNKLLSKRLYNRILLLFVFPIAPFIFVYDLIIFMRKLNKESKEEK